MANGSGESIPARADASTHRDPAEALAARIWAARQEQRLLVAPSLEDPPSALDLGTAYQVQALLHERRLARGERDAGWKIGYTSAAMREQMGVAEPNCGPLTDAMILDADTTSARSGDGTPGARLGDWLRHPRVEPEIALVLAEDVDGPRPIPELRAAVGMVRAALEVVDSTWAGYRFALEDNTADGSSAAQVALGDAIDAGADLAALAVDLDVNGEIVATSTGAAAMGNPLHALDWLVRWLAEHDRTLPAGSVVMTGGLTAAYPVSPGTTVTATFRGAAGTASVRVRR